jgi:hypothetical protein
MINGKKRAPHWFLYYFVGVRNMEEYFINTVRAAMVISKLV